MPKGLHGFQKGHLTFISKETYKRIGKEKKGKPILAFKGLKPMLGKHHSEETKKKLSEYSKKIGRIPPSRKGSPPNSGSFKKGLNPWNKNKHMPQIIGENHWNWKGGITPRSLNSLEYKLWRTAVFERDNYTCIWCGDNKGGNLEADHIKPWCDYPELRFAIDNGRTLCKTCHRTTNTYGGRRKLNGN